MSLPTIFFSTNTGSNSDHADFIQRVCNEISTSSFTKQFRTVSVITSNSIEILQELDTYKDEVAFFYFGGGEEHFVALLDASLSARYGSLFEYLTHLRKLDLVFLSYCSREQFVQPLLEGGIQTVVSTSHSLPQIQANTFAAVFCRQYLNAGLTTQAAYVQALYQASIAPGKQERQMAGLHGSPTLRLRRWWEYSGVEPHIISELEPHIVSEPTPTSLPQPLPPYPFPGVRAYRSKETHIFFGRDTEVAALYKYLTTPRLRSILLLHGQAGVGKTSLLRAGLLPRVRQHYRLRCYSGRKTPYLFMALCQEVKPADSSEITQQDWAIWLAKQKRNLLFVIDQLETQVLTKEPKLQADFARFMAAIQTLAVNSASDKKPRVILSLREENLLALQEFLNRHHLQSRVYYFSLKPLNDEAIHQVLRNFAPTARLATHYQFAIEDKLAERIAADLTQDQHSAIGPFLQTILKKLWQAMANTSATSGQRSLQNYPQLYYSGALLSDFFVARLEKVCRQYPSINSRKVIELLFTYTSFAGIGAGRAAIKDTQPAMTTRLKDCYLLTEKADEQGNTLYLGHQLLAMPISQRFYQVTYKSTWLERRRAALDFMIGWVRFEFLRTEQVTYSTCLNRFQHIIDLKSKQLFTQLSQFYQEDIAPILRLFMFGAISFFHFAVKLTGFVTVPHHTESEVRCWLIWLAHDMVQHGKTIFLIEQLQPSWLLVRHQLWLYILTSRLVWGIVTGIIWASFFGLIIGGPSKGASAGQIGVILGLFYGLLYGLLDMMRIEGEYFQQAQRVVPTHWSFSLYILMATLLCGLVGGLRPMSFGGVSLGFISYLVFVLIGGLLIGWVWMQRSIQRKLESEIQTFVVAPWLPMTTYQGEHNSIRVKLVHGLLVWLFGGNTSNIQAMKISPNHGIKRAIHSSLRIGSITGLVIGLIVGLFWGVGYGLIYGLLGGMGFAFWCGGFDAVQHGILRLLLYFWGNAPLNYARFLDYATNELHFLQKVGGGYIFIHRYLMEHFAAMAAEAEEQISPTAD